MDKIIDCKKCGLHTTRKNIVHGDGNPDSKVFLIGEAPGYSEDSSGTPFMGRVGNLLDKFLYEAGIKRTDVYIDNVVKCRPVTPAHGNRPPTAEEITLCSSYLEDTLAQYKPKVIVAMGNVPMKYLITGRSKNIGKSRGQFLWSDKYQCYIFPVFHPASILRKFEYYSITCNDFKRLKKFIDGGFILTRQPVDYKFVGAKEILDQVLDTLDTVPAFSFDVETTGLDFLTSDMVCLNVSWQEATGFVIPFRKIFDDKGVATTDCYWDSNTMEYLLKRLRYIFSRTDAIKIGQNLKFDYKALKRYGLTVKDPVFDTLLAHYMLDENLKGMRKLKHLSWQFSDMGGYELPLEKYQKDHDLGEAIFPIPYTTLVPYGAGDVDCTFRLYNVFKDMLEKDNLTKVFNTIVMPLSNIYAEAEYNGIRVDVDYIKKLEYEYGKQIEELEKEVQIIAKKELNIRSTKQLRELLFGDMGLKSVKKTDTDLDSTDSDVLEELAKKNKIPKKILEYRKLHKLYSTYIQGLTYDMSHRVHTEYNLAFTTTGRLSSSSPNMQNIPRGSVIKNIFIADTNHTLVEGDFAQIEFRLWGSYSNDPEMIRDISSGMDIHRRVASIVFNKPEKEISDDERTIAKNCTFGVLYGRGVASLSEQYGISVSKASDIIKTFFTMYPIAKRWLDSIVLKAKRERILVNFFGRKRRFVTFNCPDKEIQEFTERQAKNYLMQSTASDITNFTAIRMDSIKNKYNATLVLNVHDCLVYNVPDEHVMEFAKALKDEAARPIRGINVPIKMDIKTGKSWGAMKKLEI